ncbi:MAG: phosphoribosylglycinamide synthetase C domain-containing protein [Nitrososphaerales archaeon]
MKFLFVTREALSVDLAWQLTKEGHEVNFFVQNASEKDVGDGFVQKVEQWEPQRDWADVILFDDIGFAATAEKLRAEGKFVVGGSTYTDKLEEDREFGQEELRRAGVPILPSWNFTSFDEAIAFIRQNPDRYVIKPSGKAQNEKELLFVGQEEDGKDVEQVLEHYKKKWASKIKVFLLQKYAQGVEIAVGAFFNGNDFVEPININFEHKRLFPNDIGPSTGEMGTSTFWSKPNFIFETTLFRMKEQLQASKYVGYVDINCIANGKGIFPLEFTSRFGYPTVSIHMEGVLSEWGTFLSDIAHGNPVQLKCKKGYQVGVVIAVPPFPFEDEKAFRKYSEDATILFKKPSLNGIHIGEVKLEEGDWKLAGRSGYSLIVTGSGMTMQEAIAQAYQSVKNVMLPNMFYRDDIGRRWSKDSDMLFAWGYL